MKSLNNDGKNPNPKPVLPDPDLTPTSEINKKNTERPYDMGNEHDHEERQNKKDEIFDQSEDPRRNPDPSGEFDIDYENIFML